MEERNKDRKLSEYLQAPIVEGFGEAGKGHVNIYLPPVSNGGCQAREMLDPVVAPVIISN
jgi:hypothetical protein